MYTSEFGRTIQAAVAAVMVILLVAARASSGHVSGPSSATIHHHHTESEIAQSVGHFRDLRSSIVGSDLRHSSSSVGSGQRQLQAAGIPRAGSGRVTRTAASRLSWTKYIARQLKRRTRGPSTRPIKVLYNWHHALLAHALRVQEGSHRIVQGCWV